MITLDVATLRAAFGAARLQFPPVQEVIDSAEAREVAARTCISLSYLKALMEVIPAFEDPSAVLEILALRPGEDRDALVPLRVLADTGRERKRFYGLLMPRDLPRGE
jgi:hypothetical protein